MWKVQIMEYSTEGCVKTFKCQTEKEARRLERGININLDHERFYTVVEPVAESR